MSSLYVMRYVGQTGLGFGVVGFGGGKILGIDVANARYQGSYSDAGGRLKGTVSLTAKQAATLVTGATLQPGQSVQMSFDWPADLGNGQPQAIMVAGRQVQVTFEKIGELP
jgi:hypothetical protein